jgi:hypothetical protein
LEVDEEEERPTGMGEKDVGVYQAVVMASWLCGALGKSQVRWGSLFAEWNWWAMSVREESVCFCFFVFLFE